MGITVHSKSDKFRLTRRALLAATALTGLAISLSPANSWPVHGNPVASGKSVLNVSNVNSSFAFANMLKAATSFVSTDPSILNNDGFPANGTLSTLLGAVVQVPDTGATWVLKLPQGGGTGGFFLSNNINVSAVGGTVNGVTYNSGGQTTGNKVSGVTIAANQTQWRIVFTFNTAIPGGGLTIGFPTGAGYSNMTGLVLCRLSDENSVDADPLALTPEWSNAVLSTGCNFLRFMAWTINSGQDTTMVSQHSYRPPTTAFSFFTSRYPPSAWCSPAGTSNIGDAYTCGDTATPSLNAWVDGLTWQWKVPNNNTTFTPTIAPNGLTAKTMVDTQGLALLASWSSLSSSSVTIGTGSKTFSVSAGMAVTVGQAIAIDGGGGNTMNATVSSYSGTTLVVSVFATTGSGTLSSWTISATGTLVSGTVYTSIYDAILDKVITRSSGMLYGPPIEVLVGICNKLRKNLWHCTPMCFSSTSATSVYNYVATNLNSVLWFVPEVCNEVWNGQFQQYSLASQRGQAFGFTTSGDRANFGWYAMRCKQFADLAASAFSSRASTLKPCIMFQAAAPSTATVSTYMWQGSDLALVASGGQGNSTWGTYTGNANYRTAGNRPIDAVSYIGYAPYYSGAQCCAFDATYLSHGAANAAGLKTAADDYASGVPASMASALAFLDNDVRAGTLASSGANGSETLLACDTLVGGLGYYPRWQAAYTALSLSTQKMVCYEGGFQSWYPSTVTANTLWGDTSYGGSTGKIAVLLAAYKNSTLCRDMVYDQMRQFMGLDPTSPNFGTLPASLYPSWFILDGSNVQFSMFPLNSIVGNAYQTLAGVAKYNAS